MRPYVLISCFDTELMPAESRELVERDYRSFWTGHKGDIEATYTTNENDLPENVIEDLCQSYRKAENYPETTGTKTSEDTIKQSPRRELP